MRVLVTGAFVNVATSVRQELARRGHRVRCFDLPHPGQPAGSSTRAGDRDLRDNRRANAIATAMTGQDAAIHLASVIPPASERHRIMPTRSTSWHQQPAGRAADTPPAPGPRVHRRAVRAHAAPATAPAWSTTRSTPTDHYTRQKAARQRLARESARDWTILRLGAVVPYTIATQCPQVALGAMFEVPPRQRAEVAHRRDASVALAHAAASDEVWRRTLLTGGVPGRQVRQCGLVADSPGAWGIGLPAEEAFTTAPCSMDWLDTAESQRVLRYQRHSFADFRAETRAAAARWQLALRLAAPRPAADRRATPHLRRQVTK
jgi:UDP-glucose 4-epimerase